MSKNEEENCTVDLAGSEDHSPNLTFLHTKKFQSKFLPLTSSPVLLKSFTSSISSLVEDSSSTLKKKSQSISTNRENVLVEALKNRTAVKSQRSENNITKTLSEKVEKNEKFLTELENSKKCSSIVNINRILLKTKRILKNVRRKLMMKEYQKTKTRNIHLINDFTMELTDKKPERTLSYVWLLTFFQIFAGKITQLSRKYLGSFLFSWRILYLSFVFLISFLLTIDCFFKVSTPLEHTPLIAIAPWFLLLNVFLGMKKKKISTIKNFTNFFRVFFTSTLSLDFSSFLVLIFILFGVITSKDFWVLLYLFQLYNYFPIHRKIMRKIFSHRQIQKIFYMVCLVVKTVVLAHFLACVSYYLSLENQNSEYLTWDSKYLTSLHESLSQIFLINSQNIQIFNTKSTGFSCFAIFVSGFWYLYLIKVFLCTFDEKKQKTFETFEEEHFKVLIRCMNRMKIRKELILNVKDYLENIDSENKKVLISLTNNEAFNKLSKSLQNDFLSATQHKVFGSLPVLKKNFSEEFLLKLLPKINVTHYNPENVIYNKSEFGDNFLFIIAFGQVELYVKLGQKQEIHHSFRRVLKGDVFGEFSFFADSPKTHYAKAVTPVSIYRISRQDFLDLLRTFPEDYENYCLIKDSLLNYGDFKVLKLICTCCQASDHDIEHCPLLTLQLNYSDVIKRHVYSRNQERLAHQRKFKKTMNSLFNYKRIEAQALKIEIPANFSSSCEKSENNSDDNSNMQTNMPTLKSPPNLPSKPIDSSPKAKGDGSLKCYDTFDDLGNSALRAHSSKKGSLLDNKPRLDPTKREDPWKGSYENLKRPEKKENSWNNMSRDNMKRPEKKEGSWLNADVKRQDKKEDSWNLSLIEQVKRGDKRDDSWKTDLEPINQKFCSLEILMEERSRRKMYDKGSEAELNPNLLRVTDEEKEKDKDDSNGTVNTGDSRLTNNNPTPIHGASHQDIKKSVFNKAASNEELRKRNSGSYGSFSANSLQNLNFFKEDHFFQTDEILGGTNKGGTTTVATIHEYLLKNFEIMASFKVYFPHNNVENVLKWCRILQKGKKNK